MIRIGSLIIALIISLISINAWAESRYVHSGDGTIDIASAKNGAAFKGPYRAGDGSYDQSALRKIDRVFGARAGATEPRFIEFLDYLQDEMHGGRILVTSGYRSPRYNTSLRNNGKLAGKASMHQYGMAADLRMKGVDPEKIWYFVRELGYGGVGYYHGANAHVDVGPARFWDETTSKVGTDHADDNKLITLIPGQDIYHPGETMEMRFVRMTAFPIGIESTFVLESEKDGSWKKAKELKVQFTKSTEGSCPKLSTIDEMDNIRTDLPTNVKPGRYRIHAMFCDKQWEAMPDSITSYIFVIEKSQTTNYKSQTNPK